VRVKPSRARRVARPYPTLYKFCWASSSLKAGYTVMCEEVIICGGIQSGTVTTDVIRSRSDEVMCRALGGRYLIATLAVALLSVLAPLYGYCSAISARTLGLYVDFLLD
jgi:hypothetical protein